MLLAVGVVALAAGIAARLYHLEIRSADSMQSRARRQHEREVEVWGRRGAIVDRRGR
jgi:cell division protein FtsI/penicillin-binding protein 2